MKTLTAILFLIFFIHPSLAKQPQDISNHQNNHSEASFPPKDGISKLIMEYNNNYLKINPSTLLSKAYIYIRFRTDLDYIQNLAISNQSKIEYIRDILYSYSSNTLNQSWFAYCSWLIIKNPNFKKEIKYLQKKMRLNDNNFDYFIRVNPEALYDLPSFLASIETIRITAANDVKKINLLAISLRNSAQAIGKTRWGKKKLPYGKLRIDKSKTFAYKRNNNIPLTNNYPIAAIQFPIPQNNWNSDWSGFLHTLSFFANNKRPFFFHIGRIAALEAINRLNEPTLIAYANTNKQCFNFTSLALNQCISASYSNVEELYCLSKHGFSDISKCIANTAQ